MSNNISLELIRIDGGTQPREDLNQDVIRDYAQDMMLGVTFPPITVFHDGSEYWLADGFHRYHAAKQICKEGIEADVRQGTRRDAVLFSVGANASHGLRRTNADKRRAVETLLRDEEWMKWSDREIAKRCGVDHKTVGGIRADLCGEIPHMTRMMERNGTQYTIVTHANNRTEHSPEIVHAPGYMTREEPPITETITTRQFVDEAFPGFSQWQRDNLDLGSDVWGDVPEQDEKQEIATPEYIDVPVIPPETTTRLQELEGQIATLKRQKENLAKLNEELSADLDANEEQREREARELRIRKAWKDATEGIYKAINTFMGQLPLSIDTQLFDTEDWARLTEVEARFEQTLSTLSHLREATTGQFVESSVIGAVEQWDAALS